MAIQNYYFNNLDAKLASDSFWDFNLTDDERNYTKEVIYNSDVMYYSGGTTLFGTTFYSYKFPTYLDLHDPKCSEQKDIPSLSNPESGGISLITNPLTTAAARTPGTYNIGVSDYITSGVGYGATFDILVTVGGVTSLVASTAYYNGWSGGRGFVNGDTITITDANLGGGGAANLVMTVQTATITTPENSGTFYSGNTLLSKMAWSEAEVTDGQKIKDFGLTSIDNGLTDSLTGSVFTIATSIPTSETFNPEWYDYRLKMHAVTGYTSTHDPRTNGGILTFIVVPGTETNLNRPAGNYTVNYGNYTTTSAAGINADFSITVDALGTTTVTDVIIQDPGEFYVINDVITIPPAMLGEFPGGILTFTVVPGTETEVNRPAGTYTVNYGTYTTTGVGVNANFSIVVDALGTTTVTDVSILDSGENYILNETITIPPTMLGDLVSATNLQLQVQTFIVPVLPDPTLQLQIQTVTNEANGTGVFDKTITYGMRSNYDRSGFYYDLYGGFFQGFYNLFSYGYSILPIRPDNGWTVECLLKVRSSGSSWDNRVTNTLNTKYPENEGIFWYMGARAENKFWNCFHGETGFTTSVGNPLYNCTGTCVHTGFTGDTCIGAANYVCDDPTYTDETSCTGAGSIWDTNGTSTGWTYSQSVFGGNYYSSASTEYQILSNNLALRLSGGSAEGYKLCYRTLRYTGNTSVTGTSDNFACSGGTFATGFTLEEKCTKYPICTGTTDDSWMKVDAVWRRNHTYETAYEKLWRGGVNLITTLTCESENSVDSGSTATTITITEGEKLYLQNIAWIQDIKNRYGTLTLYSNSRPVLTINDFEEIIPRRLNEVAEKQLGVPYSMSFGGGSQGLYESLTYSGSSNLDASVLKSNSISDTNYDPVIYGKLFSAGITAGIADILRVAGTYNITPAVYTTSGVGQGATLDITIDTAGDVSNIIIPAPPNDRGFGFVVGDTITIPDANLGAGGAVDLILSLDKTSTGTVTYDSDGGAFLESEIYDGTQRQNSVIFYKAYNNFAIDDLNYNHPIISATTYDVIVEANIISNDSGGNPPKLDLGFSGATATAPTPEVTYLIQNEILTTTKMTLHREYKPSTITGDLFIAISPNSSGKIEITNMSVIRRAYKRDPADESMLIEKNFAGTYMGGISQMRYYNRPLDASELKHNYYTNVNRYGLIDCDCGNDDIFIEGCDTEYATYTFPIGASPPTGNIDTVSLDFGDKMVRWDTFTSENVATWNGTSNSHPLPMRYSSVDPYCCSSTDVSCNEDNYLNCQTEADCISTAWGKCSATWYDSGNLTPAIVKFPFTSVPSKPLTITITRTDPTQLSTITFTGKQVR
tara:strand:+ start:6886 stop:10887 length:4002 start_codon:yes stop_codon:yes gene_type:complete